jgi:hypothetical protein
VQPQAQSIIDAQNTIQLDHNPTVRMAHFLLGAGPELLTEADTPQSA